MQMNIHDSRGGTNKLWANEINHKNSIQSHGLQASMLAPVGRIECFSSSCGMFSEEHFLSHDTKNNMLEALKLKVRGVKGTVHPRMET